MSSTISTAPEQRSRSATSLSRPAVAEGLGGSSALRVRLPQARDQYDYYEGHLDSSAEHTDYLTGDLVDDYEGVRDVFKVPTGQIGEVIAAATQAWLKRGTGGSLAVYTTELKTRGGISPPPTG